ncbi:hypothetical protein BSKO_08558 [Bryopsis sp. KO-2023]|nr:hypothetical protein BSKO_08558 [Bryopsis sp. KO-2023]
MDNLLLPSEETTNWNLQDWRWDPFKMEAEPAKRSAPSRGRGQRGPVVCQVEGCGADLTGLKEYHQRYKICEYHLKVSSIIKDAVQQRFCQQCGRFHVLSEFDGVKRSCRARLERHNARRRKSSLNRRASSIAPSTLAKEESKGPDSGDSQYEVEMSQYEMEDVFQPSEAMVDPIFPSVSVVPSQEPRSVDGSNQEALMQLEQIFYDTGDIDQSQSPSAMEGSDTMQVDPRGDVRSGEEGDPIAQVFRNFSQSAEARDLWQVMQGPVRHESQSSSSMQANQVLFPSSEVLPGRPVLEPIPMLPPSGGALPSHGMLGQQTHDVHNAEPQFTNVLAQLRGGDVDRMGLAERRHPESDMFDEGGTAALYDSLLKLTSLSVKVFNCTPANLPGALRRELLNAVRGGLVPEGFMRPGCVQLTLDVRHHAQEILAIEDVVKQLVNTESGNFWKSRHFLVQLGDAVAIVNEGKVIQSLDRVSDPEIFPTAERARPLCILNEAGEKFSLTGKHISGLQDIIHCRVQGRYLPTEVDYDASDDISQEKVDCVLTDKCPCGVIRIEAAHQNILTSGVVPVLAVDDKDVVAEIRQLEEEGLPESSVHGFILDMGMVVEFRQWVLSKYGSEKSESCGEEMLREYSCEEMQAIISVSHRLLGFACEKGWKAVAEFLLPVSILGSQSADALSNNVGMQRVDGFGLLHLAVKSGRLDMVRLVQSWSTRYGVQCQVTDMSFGGVTPLHISACLNDRGVMSRFLIGENPNNAKAWFDVKTIQGMTPSDVSAKLCPASVAALVREHCLSIVRNAIVKVSACNVGVLRNRVNEGEKLLDGGSPRLIATLPHPTADDLDIYDCHHNSDNDENAIERTGVQNIIPSGLGVVKRDPVPSSRIPFKQRCVLPCEAAVRQSGPKSNQNQPTTVSSDSNKVFPVTVEVVTQPANDFVIGAVCRRPLSFESVPTETESTEKDSLRWTKLREGGGTRRMTAQNRAISKKKPLSEFRYEFSSVVTKTIFSLVVWATVMSMVEIAIRMVVC